jgi:hypothetical protein
MERNLESMSTLKAIVSGGRAIIEDMGEYPDGTVLELSIVDDDEMDDEERAKLHASLDIGLAQARAGQTRPAEEVLAKLFAKA